MQLKHFLPQGFYRFSWSIRTSFVPLFPGTNDCADSPCQNGGTCLDLEKGHVCVCDVGWSGDNCTIGKDPFFVNSMFLTLKLAGGGFIEPPPPRFFWAKIFTPRPIAKCFCTTVPR